MEILGVELPLVTIPVRPGRNTAILIETAAMGQRARRLLRPSHDDSERTLLGGLRETGMSGRIDVDGTHNFRDVGGYPAIGGRTRPGQLYRSDALSGVTAAGVADLAGLRIGVVIDLRSAARAVPGPLAVRAARAR